MSTQGKEQAASGNAAQPPAGESTARAVKLQPLDPTVKPTTKLEPVAGALPPLPPPQQPLTPLTPIKNPAPKAEPEKAEPTKTEHAKTEPIKVEPAKAEKQEEVRPSSASRPKSGGTVYPATKTKIETQTPNGKTPVEGSVKTIEIDTQIWIGLVAMFLFPPLGIVAFVLSFQVYNSLKAGNIQRARWYSAAAKGLAWTGIGASVTCVVFFLISYWAGLRLN